ncbi:MAG: 3-hydroxy-3-methylglutaryl-CoA reductase [Patescibacteria group bacterium]|nr:MAG: 3-hydroxy-3-methylglutaryl-CoA reductase [Patescibacteria group bacterium]
MKLHKFNSADQRRYALEKKLGLKLEKIKSALIEDESKLHCENLIGATILPLGVAGPLKLVSLNSGQKRLCFVPLATTEGALVASVNRGCKAISLSGGVKVFIEKVGTTRGPIFYVKNLAEAVSFKKWLTQNQSKIRSALESSSNHLKFLKFDYQIMLPYFYLRLYFDTDQAMGMNMVTIATEKLAELIEKELDIRCVSVSGNFCIDKKPAYLNFLSGRGLKVWAEIEISSAVLKQVLKTSADRIFSVWLSKNIGGSLISGSLGYNAHFANIVSAFFAAVGQDLAHTVEGSLGSTSAEIKGENLYFSIYQPAVMLGVLGGGTKLQIKQEAIKVTGAKTSQELAEVLAGAVLAGELSLLASLAEGSLAKAHKKLGR